MRVNNIKNFIKIFSLPIVICVNISLFNFPLIIAAPWDKREVNFKSQREALDACMDFTRSSLERYLKFPVDGDLTEPKDFFLKNKKGEYQILRYGCNRVGKVNDKYQEYRGYVEYLEIPEDSGDSKKFLEYKVETKGGYVFAPYDDLPRFTYKKDVDDFIQKGEFDEYSINQDWIKGIAFGMAYRLCREVFLHKTIAESQIKNRRKEDIKYLENFKDPFSGELLPSKKIAFSKAIYSARVDQCIQDGENTNWNNLPD